MADIHLNELPNTSMVLSILGYYKPSIYRGNLMKSAWLYNQTIEPQYHKIKGHKKYSYITSGVMW